MVEVKNCARLQRLLLGFECINTIHNSFSKLDILGDPGRLEVQVRQDR
jgi:hypothetical protein